MAEGRESRYFVRSRVLGLAFILQFVTSLAAGIILSLRGIGSGAPGESMLRIAAQPAFLRANILLEMVTAGGVLWLGALLFATLRGHGETMARLAFALYILEAAILAVSRIPAMALIGISRDYAGSGSASLLAQGSFGLACAESAYTLMMLSFCAGAFLFYWLLFRSRAVPRGISLWGLIALVPVSIATVLTVLGIAAPFYLYVPYIPFEFVIGLWILIAGIKVSPDTHLE